MPTPEILQETTPPVAEETASEQTDQTDPVSTAKAVLEAYQQKSFAALSPLCTPDNRDLMAEIGRQGKDHPRYESITSGWRWEAVRKWKGEIGEVRLQSDTTSLVKFGEIDASEVAVVTLELIDGKWCFEDVHSPAKADFESMTLR